jgi:peptidase E
MSPTLQIIAMGGYEIDGPFGPPSELERYLFDAAGVARPRVCLVPTATGDSSLMHHRFAEIAGVLPSEPSVLELFDRTVEDLDAFLDAIDVVYVGGGNTANLLAVWRVHGLDAALARRAESRDLVVGGASAGGMCWFEGGLTDSFGRETRPLHDGLGWLTGTFCPHFHADPRRGRYQKLVGRGDLTPGWGIDDGAAIHVVDGRLDRAIRASDGARAYRVDDSGAHVVVCDDIRS